jgi:hypothetical protein
VEQFDYFVSFYSIVLGLSVVELLTGTARTIEGRMVVKTSRLTLGLALFVSLDISSYWLQAWALYRQAPLSMAVITHGLIAAGSYFIAAYLVFPRAQKLKRGESRDDHFWSTRRWVFGAVLLTNVLNIGSLALLSGGFGYMGSPGYIAFISTFYIACAVAVVAPRGRVVVIALGWLIAFSLIAILMDGLNALENGRWSINPW